MKTSTTGRWAVFSHTPAVEWEDAFVCGNGRQGAMVFGAPGHERLTLVHEELFVRGYDRRTRAAPDIAHLMPEIRRLSTEGHMQAAADLACGEARRQLNDVGATQVWSSSPHPAFDLTFRQPVQGALSDYRRGLDLESGEAETTWTDAAGSFRQTTFTSRTDDVTVVRLRATAGRKLDLELSLTETPGRAGVKYDLDIGGGIRSVTSVASPGWLSYRARYEHDGGGYDGIARVTATGGSLACDGDRILVQAAEEVLIVVRITPFAPDEAPSRSAMQEDLAALPDDYAALLAPHARSHGSMFRRVGLDLGAAAEWAAVPVEAMLQDVRAHGPSALFYEQMHAMGRYLLISSCGGYPPPLQGIWGGGWHPEWVGGFVLDTNLNLAISNVSMGGLPECAESYFRYVEQVLPGWRANARGYLGCRGFLVSHYADPETGYLNHFMAEYPWMFWAAGAGWNIMPMYEHALITGDLTLLRDRVLPLYLEMADFYEDYLVLGADGRSHVIPSISPENFVNGSLLARDATMDIAVAREVFDHLAIMGRMLGLEAADIAGWESRRDRMADYRVNGDGALAEWCDDAFPDFYEHRHASHLYPVFPGREFLQPGADPALIEAARVALDKRFATDTDSAHGLIHVALMAARLKDTEMIRANMDRFARRDYVYGGLVTAHYPDRQIYNLDSILSLPRLIAEMVVFSQPGRIELLPALPPGYPDGTLRGLCIHGGHTIDVTWAGGKLSAATLHAGRDTTIDVVAGGVARALELSAGRAYDVA